LEGERDTYLIKRGKDTVCTFDFGALSLSPFLALLEPRPIKRCTMMCLR